MSKRIWNHPEERQTGRKYWRSLGELDDTPEFREWLDREFPQGAAMMRDESDADVSRRSFLKLMGAATSLAGFGMAACRRPETHIKPYSKNVEWVIPGKALFYATSMPRLLGGATPLVVTTFEGRPTHVQGNALHKESNGSVDSFAQASILDLYDPDRSKDFLKAGVKSTRAEFLAFLEAEKAALSAAQGKGLALLLDGVTSPTRQRLVAKVQAAYPQAKVYRYEAFDNTNQEAATEIAFGKGVQQVPHFSKADRILSLDSDFLGLFRPKASSVSKFMDGRRALKPEDPMNRLYVVEGRYTATGGMADHRLRVPASQIMKVAVDVAKAVAAATGDAGLKSAAEAVKVGSEKPSSREDYAAWVEEAGKDLAGKKGRAFVLAGPQQPKEVHLLVAAINQALGAFGGPVELKQIESTETGTLAQLAESAKKGEVTHLVMVGQTDPVYDALADIDWAKAQKAVKHVIHSGVRHRTATARAASWHVPGTHYLEQWGDLRGISGAVSVIQPMILPLYEGVSDIQLLSLLAAPPVPAAPAVPAPAPAAPANGALPEESKDTGYLAVRETFKLLAKPADEAAEAVAWTSFLRDGFIANSEWPAASASLNAAAVASGVASFTDVAPPNAGKMELNLVPCSKLWDGRYTNNGWLQESPDPISKVTWDNVALVSVRTANDMKLKKSLVDDDADVIKLTLPGGAEVEVPVIVAPGHADNSITLAVGYGQGEGENGPGRVGEATGWNTYPLRTTKAPYFISGVDVKKTGVLMPVACTQEHNTMYGRELVREGTSDRFKEHADFAKTEGQDGHIPQDFSLYKPNDLKGQPLLSDKVHQWAMTIDLNTCIGCNTCSVACQSENNIPIVGKRAVIIGREMHWIRMDRYFAVDLDGGHRKEGQEFEPGSPAVAPAKHGEGAEVREIDDPEMLFQPVACQHCEAAPCETVCPVNATVHSEDGLNLMVYNRCIGTRYCANNCPYKARRFNHFDYGKREPLHKPDGSKDNMHEKESDWLGLKPAIRNNLQLGPLGEIYQPESLKLQKNPNVTVRMRGVIEKCTYCIQRIEAARIDAKKVSRTKAAELGQSNANLKISETDLQIKTDTVKTACQLACPADAIVFGNMADEKSKVTQMINHPRNYQILRYIGTRPRTSYLARIKNPNPQLLARSPKEAAKVGQATAHMH